ncbi:hypothetical protein OEZ85_014090 [Tetradesmus obliquus]|uniref:FAST kinase leucine-rich domain-containing protein n=1 Tax=Tetradesmus obliquus TaxID=3088 RepID=A0ABY8U7L9_TETOB|nr:hypothetical protein OEZ85_014090 [Tetradesmus obliquus]
MGCMRLWAVAAASAAGADALAPARFLPAAQPCELVMVLWACSKLGLQPSRAVQSQLWAAAAGVACLTGSEAAAVLHAVARLRLRPPPAWMAALLAGSQRQLGSLSFQQLAVMVWACGALRCRPPVAWMHAALGQLAAQLQGSQPLPPASLSMTVWGLSQLGFQPSQPAAHALLAAVEALAQDLRPHNLSKMLLGCSRLRWAVPAALLASLEAQLQQASPADVTLALRAAATQQQAGQHTRQHQRPWLLQQHVPGAAGWAAGNSNPAALLAVQCSTIAVAPGLPVVALRSFGWQQHCQQGMARATVQNNTKHTQYAPGIDGGARAAPGSCGVRGVGPNNQLVQLLLQRAEDLLWGMTATELCQCLWAAVRLQATPSVQWGQAINHTLSAQMHQLGPGNLA